MNARQRRKARRLPHPDFVAWGRCPTCRAGAGAPCLLPFNRRQRGPFSEVRAALVHGGRPAMRASYHDLWTAALRAPIAPFWPGAGPAFNLPDLRGLFPTPRRNWAGCDPTPEELAQVRAAGIPSAADLPKS